LTVLLLVVERKSQERYDIAVAEGTHVVEIDENSEDVEKNDRIFNIHLHLEKLLAKKAFGFFGFSSLLLYIHVKYRV
jgi:hypothetical protein